VLDGLIRCFETMQKAEQNFCEVRSREKTILDEDEDLAFKNMPGRLPVIKVDQLHDRLLVGWANARYRKGPCLLALQRECIISGCNKDEVGPAF
jgi:hypothetical protein